ncbi:MAG: hypothetical protein NVSMB33_17400 [Ktedonobacteraceae bacterium]
MIAQKKLAEHDLISMMRGAIKYSSAGSEIEVGLRRITGTVDEAFFFVQLPLNYEHEGAFVPDTGQ